MKLKLLSLVVGSLFALPAGATMYDFSYIFSGENIGSGIVEGSFSGFADGNLITNLSDISVSFNGNPFVGSGELFDFHYKIVINYYGILSGSVVSFDGTQNNFIFMDVNYTLGNQRDTNYFRSFNNEIDVRMFSPSFSYALDNNKTWSNRTYNKNGSWTVTERTSFVPEPESLALFLLGLPMVAWVKRRKSA
jgi:hypothetical protein